MYKNIGEGGCFMADIIVIESNSLPKGYDKCYVIVDKDSGGILDDAQGYSYKTVQKAHAAWSYKTRDKTKDKIKAEKHKRIQKWMKEHKSFVKDMNSYSFEIAKGSCAPNDKFDAKFVKEMLEENNLKVDFTASELLKVWRNYSKIKK